METKADAYKILIVEDDSWFAGSLGRTLKAHGFETFWAPSAQAAAEMVGQHPFDAIVLDIFLHQANGLQLLHELRSYDDSFDVPVIVCSSAASDILPRSLESYGVLAVLDKASLTPAALIEAVVGVLKL